MNVSYQQHTKKHNERCFPKNGRYRVLPTKTANAQLDLGLHDIVIRRRDLSSPVEKGEVLEHSMHIRLAR